MSDEPLTVCPECQGKLTKMVYPTGVMFKGSGFYTTDYRDAGKGAASNGSSSESKTETASESGKESQSSKESKSDSKD